MKMNHETGGAGQRPVFKQSDPAGEHPQYTTGETIRWRFHQPEVSRLCEYVTGIPLESPAIVERVIADHEIIRAKYGLPHRNARFDSPIWYEDFLRGLAAKENIEIVGTTQCGNYFQAYNAAAAYFPENGRAGVDIDRRVRNAYVASLIDLEHEVIHGLQFNRYPRMPIEFMEYEAYVAGGKIALYREIPECIDDVFGYYISGSVELYFDELSDTLGRPVIPEWRRAEYFIREIDGIDIESLPTPDRRYFEVNQRQEAASLKIEPGL